MPKKTIDQIRAELQKEVDYIIEITNMIERSYDYLDVKAKDDNHIDVDRIISMQLISVKKQTYDTAKQAHLQREKYKNHVKEYKKQIQTDPHKEKPFVYDTERNHDSFIRGGLHVLVESIKYIAK